MTQANAHPYRIGYLTARLLSVFGWILVGLGVIAGIAMLVMLAGTILDFGQQAVAFGPGELVGADWATLAGFSAILMVSGISQVGMAQLIRAIFDMATAQRESLDLLRGQSA